MKIRFQKDAEGSGAHALVEGLSTYEGKIEPIFVVRAGDPLFEQTVEEYSRRAMRPYFKGEGSLKEKLSLAAGFPKHRVDGNVSETVAQLPEPGSEGESALLPPPAEDETLQKLLDELMTALNEGGKGVLMKVTGIAKAIDEHRNPPAQA